MKKKYFILFLCFIILGLIFSFENIMMRTQVLILFKSISQSLFFTIMQGMIIGVFAGFFLGLSITGKKNNNALPGGSDIDL